MERADKPGDDEIVEAPVGPSPEALLLQARDEARRQGEAQGLEAGSKRGFEQGYAEGQAAGHAAGQQAGYEAGQQEAREEGRVHAQRLHALAEDFAATVSGLEDEMGQAVVALALDIARQVVRSELAARPESLIVAVREVLHMHTGTGAPLRLWAHPDDIELLRQHLGDELKEAHWRLLADESVGRGGCRAQTPLGEIDGSLATRWSRVAASLGLESTWDGADE